MGDRRSGRRLLAGLVLLGAVGLVQCASLPPPPLHVFPVRGYELPSGLRVSILQDDASGISGVAWVIDAGQTEDPIGKPGVAHLLEHLMLRAPSKSGVSLWRALGDMGAGHINGFTSLDRTTYQAFTSASTAIEMIAQMAARFADPMFGVDQAGIPAPTPSAGCGSSWTRPEHPRSRSRTCARSPRGTTVPSA